MLLLGVEEQRAKVGGGVGMTTDIDLLLLQRSGTVRKAVCTFVCVCRGESDGRGCVFVVWSVWKRRSEDVFGIPCAAGRTHTRGRAAGGFVSGF